MGVKNGVPPGIRLKVLTNEHNLCLIIYQKYNIHAEVAEW